MTTVMANKNKPARRFSNQTRISPIKAVRKGRNIYIDEFYRRIPRLLLNSVITQISAGLLFRMPA
jgi:hypothetical protein